MKYGRKIINFRELLDRSTMHSSSTNENQAGQPWTSGQMSSRSKRELIECPICTMTVKDPK